MDTTTTTQQYDGWTITFGVDGDSFGDWDGLDQDASMIKYEDVAVAAVQAAYPGAEVETVSGIDSYATRPHVYPSDDSNENDTEGYEQAVSEILENVLSRRAGEWIVEAA